MNRSFWIAWIGRTCLMAGILAGAGHAVAQPSEGQQHSVSGGTQGLQERIYEERMKELQQSQPGAQQSQGKEDMAGKRQGSGTTGAQAQGSADQRPSASGHGSPRTDK